MPCLLLLALSVFHPVSCSYCRGNGMSGFRYRCLRCRGYQLCQDCFWRGNASGSHNNQHQMKEHSSWVSHRRPTCLSHPGGVWWCLCVRVHARRALGPQPLKSYHDGELNGGSSVRKNKRRPGPNGVDVHDERQDSRQCRSAI